LAYYREGVTTWITARTDASGNVTFMATFDLPTGSFITATATDPLNNTSALSNTVAVRS
jgi:hypothetical protein